jgi:hypothetical protein
MSDGPGYMLSKHDDVPMLKIKPEKDMDPNLIDKQSSETR